jgi:hypothetical protein
MVSVPLTDTINVLPIDTTNAFCSNVLHHRLLIFFFLLSAVIFFVAAVFIRRLVDLHLLINKNNKLFLFTFVLTN